MSVKSWFNKVKVAVAYQNKKNMAFWVYCDHKDKVCPLEDVAEYPNVKLEQQIRKSICAVKYCPEDWLGMLSEDAGGTASKKCDNFDIGEARCTNTKCPVYAANCAYFDAKAAYNATLDARNNAIRRVFGLRAK